MLNVPQVAGVGWFCGFRSFLDSVMILLGWAAGAEANVCWTFLPLPLMQEPDTDLEVVLEKKGNMDEAHIDQVWPRSSYPALHLATRLKTHTRLLPGHKILVP